MKKLLLTCCLAVTCLLGAVAPAARAQTGTPQSPYVITAAPYAISKPGYYILGTNLNYAATSGNIITVSANNVTLDFNGFYIAGPNTIS